VIQGVANLSIRDTENIMNISQFPAEDHLNCDEQTDFGLTTAPPQKAAKPRAKSGGKRNNKGQKLQAKSHDLPVSRLNLICKTTNY
jgi:hypothetical protein